MADKPFEMIADDVAILRDVMVAMRDGVRLATDIYLPALPELTHSLRGTITEGQITLAVYFVGLGLGQLFYGFFYLCYFVLYVFIIAINFVGNVF